MTHEAMDLLRELYEHCKWRNIPIELLRRVRDALLAQSKAAPPAGEGKPTLTYPPEPPSWVAIKGDKPTVVVEKAAYDDLRARYAALVESNHSELAGGDR
jgi:hypothetical protein